MTDYAKIQFLG